MDRSARPHPRPIPTLGLFEREAATLARVRALLTLQASRATGATEARDGALAAADNARDRAQAHARKELDRRLAKAQAELAEKLAQIDSQHAERAQATGRSWEAKRSAMHERHERMIDRAERDCRDAVWLAETVYESARPRPGQDFDAICKSLDADLKTIGELEEFVASLWPRVGRAAPAEPDVSGATLEEAAGFDAALEAVRSAARELDRLFLPRVFRSGVLWVLAPGAALGAGAGLGFALGWSTWQVPLGVGVGLGLLLAGALVPLGGRARRQFLDSLTAFRRLALAARAEAAATRDEGMHRRDEALEGLLAQCKAEVDRARAELQAVRQITEAEHAERMMELEKEALAETRGLERSLHGAREEAEARAAEYVARARATHDEEVGTAAVAHQEQTALARSAWEGVASEVQSVWSRETAEIRHELAEIREAAEDACPTWAQRLDGVWSFGSRTPFATRVGVVRADLASLGPLPTDAVSPRDAIADPVVVPIVLDVASRGSLLIEAEPGARDAAIRLAQTVVLRLLCSAPPGRAKLTIFDPVGRGRSFAGMMRLADFDESLVGARIWTESRHMEQRLTDLTEHIENVIQKYLRDDYATIDEYNRIAGEIAEPYRYLVIADFPANFSEDAAVRLASIVDAGARCGVFVVMLVDPGAKMPPGIDLRELRARAIVVESAADGAFRIADRGMRDLAFEPDAAPSETQTLDLLHRIGEEAQLAGRVEVHYSVVEPRSEQLWSRSCAEELRIPIGRAGATKAQELRLGRGTSQHVLVAGKTGSGKSTLLHVLATAAMLWHAPSEVEFYLVDFKKGVEFKPYASGDLPHIRAVAIESDREFGLSVLQKLDVELRNRGDLFRGRGVQSISQFRERFPNEAMPRSILMIDEFQEFFVEDDRIAQDASLLLDRLVRQGRAFGIHVLLASQTLSGAYSLARSTVGQMAVRIALKCSETDSYLILSEDNGAARLLSRPGEAIYNDANGLVEGNNPFQIAWLSDDERQDVLERLATLAKRHNLHFEEPVFFEGNAAADLSRNRQLRKAARERIRPIAPLAWLGEPVSIKEPTGAIMRRRGGANILIVGQRSETAAAMLASSVISLAVQHEVDGPRAPRFLVVEGTPEDDPLAGRLHEVLRPLAHAVRAIPWREAPVAVAEAHAEMAAREQANRTDGPPIYVVLHGLHWMRSLRRREDDLSFSSFGQDDKAPAPDQQLKQLLVDGPRLGVFVLAWCDTTSSLMRALDRAAIAEFGNRVLMQMSANDSSMLIESTSAARLGLHRAIFFDEERGAEEKFRPYGLPDASFVRQIADEAAGRAGD